MGGGAANTHCEELKRVYFSIRPPLATSFMAPMAGLIIFILAISENYRAAMMTVWMNFPPLPSMCVCVCVYVQPCKDLHPTQTAK